MALVATANNFTDSHRILSSMISWADGAASWSTAHNSKFEASKSVLIDFSRAKNIAWPSMLLQGCIIALQESHKLLGVMIDQELRWQQQADYALEKATKWTLAFRRLARPTMGVNLWLMRQMYCAVVLPKMMYVADVWYMPTHKREGAEKTSGSVGITRRMASMQRMASMAIQVRCTPHQLTY